MAETDSVRNLRVARAVLVIVIALSAVVALIAVIVLSTHAQGPPAPTPTVKIEPSFADVKLGPGTVAVVVRDTHGADQMIVSTFYWQKLQGIDKPIMLSFTDVVPVVKDVAVAAQGPANPSDVVKVHVSLVTIAGRMEWTPPPAVTPAK